MSAVAVGGDGWELGFGDVGGGRSGGGFRCRGTSFRWMMVGGIRLFVRSAHTLWEPAVEIVSCGRSKLRREGIGSECDTGNAG